MAGEFDMFQEPQCLIDSDRTTGQLCVNPGVLQQFQLIENPLNVVAIAGLYRTGKSYLMNRLTGNCQGFALGSKVQSKTKGIWVWCVPHPIYKEQVLVLLDTEGLGDIDKGDANHDSWIFALATLLTSTLVYNTLGAFDQSALEKLNFVTEISKRIKTKQDENANTNFDCYFPMFVVALRDFSLELEIDGVEVDADGYLEHCLALREEKDERGRKFNEPRRCIRRFFSNRKCFTFDRPGGKQKLKILEKLKDSDLEEEFVEDSNKFCEFIHKHCPPKKLDTGMSVTGRMFATLVSTYVEAIRDGAVPCIENALNTMAIIENTRAVEEGAKLYLQWMNERVKLPTESDEEMSDAHHACVKEAVAFFLKKAIYDIDGDFQENMNLNINDKYEQLKRENAEASIKKCREILAYLGEFITRKLKEGLYMCAGGYTIYQDDLHQLQVQYENESLLGVKKQDTYMEFLKEKWVEGQSILAADQKVSAGEKMAEAERQKAMEAERQKGAAEREGKLKDEHAKDIEKMMKENLDQLEKRREEDMKNMQDHYEGVINKRLAEQQRTMQEGFEKESDKLRDEIEQLKPKPKSPPPTPKKKCFADTSLVKVKGTNGKITTKMLAELNVGDNVQSFDFETCEIVFSPVYFITHDEDNVGTLGGHVMVFLKVCDGESGKARERGIRLDESHLLYVTKGDQANPELPHYPIKASEVAVEDLLWIVSDDVLVPRRVTEISTIQSAIRHPMTMNHVIVVDGVLASVHMHHERLYRALTSPLRLLYSVAPSLVQSGFVRNAVNAWDYVENFL